jgi:hypothetical protein
MSAASHKLELSLLPGRFSISRLPAGAAIPAWAAKGSFVSVTQTEEELSIVCEESLVPAGTKSQPGWRALKVHGPIQFSEVGVLAALTAPLAEAKISLFAVSTFDTDYLFVRAETLADAISALERVGHTIHKSSPQ